MGSNKYRKAFDGLSVRRTPYTKARPGDPSKDRDLFGKPVPSNQLVFFQEKKTPAGVVENVLPLRYGGTYYGYTDWQYDKGKRDFRWLIVLYVLLDGKVHVGKRYAKAPPEIWRERAFAERGMLVNADGVVLK